MHPTHHQCSALGDTFARALDAVLEVVLTRRPVHSHDETAHVPRVKMALAAPPAAGFAVLILELGHEPLQRVALHVPKVGARLVLDVAKRLTPCINTHGASKG